MPDQTERPLPPHAGRAAALPLMGMTLDSHRLDSVPVPRRIEDGTPEVQDRIFRALPRRAPPAEGYPVLYLLDGNAAFDFLTAEMLAAAPGLAVIGIGYDTDRQFARERRSVDYTPPDAEGRGLRRDPHPPHRLCGGAAGFLERLAGPLRVAAEQDFPVARRTLWGHSIGGLCTLFAAATRPGLFDRYAMISPSCWWDTPVAMGLASRIGDRTPVPVLLGVGDSERRTGSAAAAPKGLPEPTAALRDLLAAQPGVALDFRLYPDHVHIATLPASLPATLALAAA